MREILFRGKGIFTNKWQKGYLIDNIYGGQPVIVTSSNLNDGNHVEIDYEHIIPETVGQYTGLTDINGTKIFEGDVVKHYYYDGINPQEFVLSMIKFDCIKARFYKMNIEDCTNWSISSHCKYEVIGNIHDNPELLKGE